MKTYFVPLFLILLMFVSGAAVFPFMLNSVPIHFGPDGLPNGFGPRWIAAFSVPLNTVVVSVFFLLAPRIDRLIRRNRPAGVYDDFRDTLYRWFTAYVSFLLLTHVVLLMGTFGYYGEPVRVLTSGIGILLITLGNELGRLRPHTFLGIHIFWLVDNETAWRLAHRLAARIFVIHGVIVLFSSVLLPMQMSNIVMLGGIMAAPTISLIGSFIVARRVSKSA